jgi:hypothetical protein
MSSSLAVSKRHGLAVLLVTEDGTTTARFHRAGHLETLRCRIGNHTISMKETDGHFYCIV